MPLPDITWARVTLDHETEQMPLSVWDWPDHLSARLSSMLAHRLPGAYEDLDDALDVFVHDPDSDHLFHQAEQEIDEQQLDRGDDLVERVVDVARGLRSEDGENPEYDRALIEMGLELCGYPTGEESHRRLMAMAMGIKGQRF